LSSPSTSGKFSPPYLPCLIPFLGIPITLDLVTGILGVQVDSRASTIRWTSGQETILPFFPKLNRKRQPKNLLQKDSEYVSDMAKWPHCTLSSPLVVILDKNTNRSDLYKAARNALSCNKTVVVKGYVDTHGFEFTLKDLDEYFMVTPHRAVQVHGKSRLELHQFFLRSYHALDIAKRVKNFSRPHVPSTVEQFVKDVTNPKVVRVALGFPLPHDSAPQPFQ
jgi:hypothetical protein